MCLRCAPLTGPKALWKSMKLPDDDLLERNRDAARHRGKQWRSARSSFREFQGRIYAALMASKKVFESMVYVEFGGERFAISSYGRKDMVITPYSVSAFKAFTLDRVQGVNPILFRFTLLYKTRNRSHTHKQTTRTPPDNTACLDTGPRVNCCGRCRTHQRQRMPETTQRKCAGSG